MELIKMLFFLFNCFYDLLKDNANLRFWPSNIYLMRYTFQKDDENNFYIKNYLQKSLIKNYFFIRLQSQF